MVRVAGALAGYLRDGSSQGPGCPLGIVSEEEDVGDADEGIVLTDREREVLAGLAESIGDPWLARQLAGQSVTPGPRQRRRRAWLRPPNLKALSGWVGVALLLAGAALALAAFVHSTALASLGLVLMGVGLWRVVADRGDQVVRWAASRREGPRAETSPVPPPPPHTPPGAV